MHDVEKLPLWLAHLWDEANNPLKDAEARLDKQLHLAEALAEYLAVAFLATVLAEPHSVDPSGRGRIASAATRTFGKRAAFGDWVSLVRSGFGGGPALVSQTLGVTVEPTFEEQSAVGEFSRSVTESPPERIRLTYFLDQLVALRNERVHGRIVGSYCATLVPLLAPALDAVLTAMPAIVDRPMVYVEHARPLGDEGGDVVLYFRPLTGDGRRPLVSQFTTNDTMGRGWCGDRVVFWDRVSDAATPIPDWLIRFDKTAHHMRLCQGVTSVEDDMSYHSRQRDVVPEVDTGLAVPFWAAMKALEAPRAPASRMQSDDPHAPGDALYTTAFRRAQGSDGVITVDERVLLDTIAHGLGLSDRDRRRLEARAHDSVLTWSGELPVIRPRPAQG